MANAGSQEAPGGVPLPAAAGHEPVSGHGGCSEDDSTILRQLAAGDLAWFDVFVDRYKTRLVGYIRTRVRDHHFVEDVAQEVFMRVFRAVREGRVHDRNGTVAPWIFKVANNCVTDWQRERIRKPLSLETDTANDGQGVVTGEQSGTPDPAQCAVEAEQDRHIQTLMEQLPDEQRAVVSLKVFGQLTFAEIAEALDCPVATIKSRMRYGHQIKFFMIF
jgi:RNA polymerase sigma-70 factor (ECF subfamily)